MYLWGHRIPHLFGFQERHELHLYFLRTESQQKDSSLFGSIKTEFSLNWLFGPSIGIVVRLDDSSFLDKGSITSTSERDNFKIKLLGIQTSLQTKIEIFAIKDNGFSWIF